MECKRKNQWVDIVKSEHKFVFPIEKGPLIKFILLKDSNSLDLIVNCHHSICDGLSLVYLIRDILYYLVNFDKKIKTSLWAPPLNKDNIPTKAKSNIWTNFVIKVVNKYWNKNKIKFSEEDYENLTELFWNENSCQIIAWQLNEKQTSKLLKSCKDEEVTVNSALVTAFIAAISTGDFNNRKTHKRVHMPINIRDRLKISVGEAFGFHVGLGL